MLESERNFRSFMEADYWADYGIHRWQMADGTALAAVSAPDWVRYRDLLDTVVSTDQLVVSPELITGVVPEVVVERIEEVLRKSAGFPETTFLLGSVVYEDDQKPTNSVLFVKDGKIIGRTNKRTYATQWEKETFQAVPEERTILVPGTNIGVLICSDMAMASLYVRPDYPIDDILRIGGYDYLIGKNPQFVSDDARELVVISCWGIGARFASWHNNPDEYYRLQLKSCSANLLWYSPNLRQIAIVDRAPVMDDPKCFVSTKPLNALFTRKI